MGRRESRRRFRAAAALFSLLSAPVVRAESYYVAPSGNDGNAGTETAPFASMAKGQTAASPGDTVYLRGGNYAFTSATAADGVDLTKSGTAGKPISYVAYTGETPVLDFSGMTAAARIKGINVTASYLHLKGLEVKGVPQNLTTVHESWGIYNDGGSNNVYELLNLHHNMGPGLFIVRGSNNLVLNCDSHHNFNPKSSTGPGTNADGFGCHVNQAGNTGNVIRGCRAWWNSDDGYNLIQAQEPVTIENSWAWYNGYMPDSTTTASGGDGNGFKAGGYGLPATNVPASPPSHTVRFCVGFLNRAAGFYQNHHPVSDHFYDNTSYANKSADFNLLGLNGNVGILRNNLAVGGTLLANATGVDDASNSWSLSSVTASTADFVTVDIAGMDGPRQADGSLPDVNFLKLAAGSDLIDAGVDVGFAFNGRAPDLGAYESGPPLGAGGAPSSGGANGGGAAGASSGGAMASGGGTSLGGTSTSGGATGAAGNPSTSSGGVTGSAGTAPTAGTTGATGAGGASNGAAGQAGSPVTVPPATGAAAAGGESTTTAGAADDASGSNSGGCACHVSNTASTGQRPILFAALALLAGLRRRRVRR